MLFHPFGGTILLGGRDNFRLVQVVEGECIPFWSSIYCTRRRQEQIQNLREKGHRRRRLYNGVEGERNARVCGLEARAEN